MPNIFPEVSLAGFQDPDSPTCGVLEAIASLPSTGGRVHIPAGTYVLRRAIDLPSRISIVGEGPATVLTVPQVCTGLLTADRRSGSRSVETLKRLPVKPGWEIGICDDRQRGWWGTHAIVKRIEKNRISLASPINRILKTERKARAVIGFPLFRGLAQSDVEIRDLTIQGPKGFRGRPLDFTYSAIHFRNCCRLRLLNCTVSDWPSDGFSVQGGTDAQVLHCQAHGCKGHGFHPGTGLGSSVWSHNIARGCGGDGLYFCARVHHTVCSDSVFVENDGNGIGGVGHGGDRHDVISNNVCAHNGRCGIDANLGAEQVITGNLILGNSRDATGKWPGIRLHDLHHALVQANRCADDAEKPTQKLGIVESGGSDYNLIVSNLCHGMEMPVATVGEHTRAEGNLV